jgi:AAA15 family ATPase/GTPase
MVKTLEIKNFKSIKHLRLDCKRVNVFIGKPNTGKSNLIESIGIFSLPFVNENLRDIIRFENLTNLFYDHEVSGKIEITADAFTFEAKFADGNYKLNLDDETKNFGYKIDFDFAGKGNLRESKGNYRTLPFRFYRFVLRDNFPNWQSDFLLPPRGDNLMQILFTNKELRKSVADLFSEFGLRIVLKPQEYKIEVQKEIDDVVVAYPYALVSDTLQRVVFHFVAIETNKDSILIFEEPDAYAFPYYTKFFAERVALDTSNQYFVSTHNPYFLLSVLEKTPKDDVAIFITYLKEHQTKVRLLAQDELPEVLDLDASVFFNLDHFLGEV